jgi:hypothetical protein
MPNPTFARWSILIGASVSVSGIILYFELGRIEELRLSLTALNIASILSISMTLLGLVAVLIGGLAWARSAPLVHLLWTGVSAGVVAFLLAVFAGINIHGPTGVLVYVVFAGALGCVLILLVALDRYSQRKEN